MILILKIHLQVSFFLLKPPQKGTKHLQKQELHSIEVNTTMQQDKQYKIREIGKKYNHTVDNWLGVPE